MRSLDELYKRMDAHAVILQGMATQMERRDEAIMALLARFSEEGARKLVREVLDDLRAGASHSHKREGGAGEQRRLASPSSARRKTRVR